MLTVRPQIITLPPRMSGSGLDNFMSEIFSSDGVPRFQNININFSKLNFIEPTGVVSLSNAVRYASNCGSKVFFFGLSPISASIAYLDDSGFFEIFARKKLRSHASLRATTSPLQRIQHRDSHYWIENSFGGWLSGRLGLRTYETASVHACMMEIFNNIDNHSGTKVGCAFMQHFPATGEIVIAVSDVGVGIPQTIRRRYPEFINDVDAIRHACQEGVTSQSTMGNRGAGLKLMTDVTVLRNKGIMQIRSGRGRVSYTMAGGQQQVKLQTSPAFYPGTMIEIRLNASTFEPDEGEEEGGLEW